MKLRLITSAALALALGGCTTYGYVGDGGGYYTGAPATQYSYSGYGYGYGGYGYGAPYYAYRPGVSFGLSYGYPYYYYPGGPYRPPYYGRPYYPRPPHYHPRPDHDHDHGHGGRPDHGGRPERPPVANDGQPPPLNRAPWRDLERLRRGEYGEVTPPPRQPRPGTLDAGGGPVVGGQYGPRPGNGVRPAPPQGYRPPATRVSGMGGADGGERSMAPRPSGRSQSAPQRSAPRSDATRQRSGRSATHDTIEP